MAMFGLHQDEPSALDLLIEQAAQYNQFQQMQATAMLMMETQAEMFRAMQQAGLQSQEPPGWVRVVEQTFDVLHDLHDQCLVERIFENTSPEKRQAGCRR